MNPNTPHQSADQPAHQPLHIQGGMVIDPAHHDEPVQRDLFIHEGKIVDQLPASLPAGVSVKIIDAKGQYVMPGGVDMHTHIASVGVNTARQLQADATFQGHRLVPSTTDTGKLYSAMGYTTAIEAAVCPSDAMHAHLQLQDTPNLDTGILVLVDNHQLVIELIEKNDYAGALQVVAEILSRTGALGMKVVNPAGVAAWRRDASRDQVDDINQPIPGSTVTPKIILQTLTRISEDLNLPHPTHIHGSRLGMPGNFQILIDSLAAIQGRRAHVAHLQFYGYGKTAKGNYTSAAPQLCEFLANHPNVTADVGMVMFGPAFTVTADTPLEHSLWRRTGSAGRPAVFCEAEQEAAFGAMPASYDRHNRIHSLQWAIGMELLLLSENPWQLCVSIDHPNGGSFLHFPAIIAMLMNKPLRDEMLAKAHPYATRHTSLAKIDREMTLQEIAILTRSGPAKMLGLSCKGQLAAGADADVAIYQPSNDKPEAGQSQSAQAIQQMFARPSLVIKSGHVIAERGRSSLTLPGQQLCAAISTEHPDHSPLNQWLEQHGSISADQFGLSVQDLASIRQISKT